MRAKCQNCKEWDRQQERFRYHLAKMTDWLPMSGYDPSLRQFKCENCGFEFYVSLWEEDLLRAVEETQRRGK